MRLIGAGLPRTGTLSLKHATELLTGERCYHMNDLLRTAGHAETWCRILTGETALLDEVFDGYRCAVDWPVSSIWREAAEHYPDAIVLLSHRDSAETWWRSADRTVWELMRREPVAGFEAAYRMHEHLQDRFATPWDDAASAMAAYEAHLDAVRATIDPNRLVEYQPGDGWGPLCRALGVDEPDEPFPHANSTASFLDRNT
ncbi:MAG: sulfotransferase family protein [Actinomycetota bacterium]